MTRVGLDATPLLGARTGVGRYVAGLLAGFAEVASPPDLVLTAFTRRSVQPLRAHVRTGVEVARRHAPPRLLHAGWLRCDLPPVEWLTGPIDIFHGTNFVLPPTRRAAGVLTVHDLAYDAHPDTVTPASRRYGELVPRGLRRAAAVCTVSEAVAGELVARYDLDRSRVVVTPNGLSPRWLAGPAPAGPAELAARGLPERFMLFVGSAEPRKNLPVLLDALRLLRAARRDVPPLVLAGPAGWGGAPDLTGLPAGAVVGTGYLAEEQLTGLVAAAACLVLPSRYEGFGLTPLEALACGTPVVASDLPVLREVLGAAAAFVPVGDAAALADAIGAVLDAGRGDPAAVEVRRQRAALFSWRRCAERTLIAYRMAAG